MTFEDAHKWIEQIVKWTLDNHSADDMLELQLILDGTDMDLFYLELTRQLAERYPDEFNTNAEDDN